VEARVEQTEFISGEEANRFVWALEAETGGHGSIEQYGTSVRLEEVDAAHVVAAMERVGLDPLSEGDEPVFDVDTVGGNVLQRSRAMVRVALEFVEIRTP
jgi:hypothetical protein